MSPVSADGQGRTPTSVSLFDQGLIQVLQASVTGLQPRKPYLLALSVHSDGKGEVEPIAAFMTNPAGAAIVNGTGPIRQIVRNDAKAERRYLVIVEGSRRAGSGASPSPTSRRSGCRAAAQKTSSSPSPR